MIDLLQLRAGDTTASVDIGVGGRLAALIIDGVSLLVPRTNDPLAWGCYPMIPFAGRIRNGLLRFDGTDHQLPRNLGPHAIHGYGFTSEWRRVDDDSIEWPFTEPWPFTGRAQQRFTLTETALTIEMTVTANERQPINVGWHPWFLRTTDAGPLQFELPSSSMYRRDDAGLPDGTLVPPPAGPWDDCFTALTEDPVLRWGDLRLTLSSNADHWVVYTEPDHAVCVEPQTGPPNDANTDPLVLEAGQTHTTTFTLDWKS